MTKQNGVGFGGALARRPGKVEIARPVQRLHNLWEELRGGTP